MDKPDDEALEAVVHALAVAKSQVTSVPKGRGWFRETEANDLRERGAEIRKLIAGYPTAPMDALVGHLLGEQTTLTRYRKSA